MFFGGVFFQKLLCEKLFFLLLIFFAFFVVSVPFFPAVAIIGAWRKRDEEAKTP